MTHSSWRRNHQKYKSKMDKSRQGVVYSTANNPQPQMILDRKWSRKSTANDPVKTWGMEWILWDWLQKTGLVIKRNLFLSPFRGKGKEDATSQVNLYKTKKKRNNSEKDMVLTVYFFLCQLLQFSFKNVSSLKYLRQAGHNAEKTRLF